MENASSYLFETCRFGFIWCLVSIFKKNNKIFFSVCFLHVIHIVEKIHDLKDIRHNLPSSSVFQTWEIPIYLHGSWNISHTIPWLSLLPFLNLFQFSYILSETGLNNQKQHMVFKIWAQHGFTHSRIMPFVILFSTFFLVINIWLTLSLLLRIKFSIITSRSLFGMEIVNSEPSSLLM